MAIDRFMIAPLNSGLETNQKPWLIPDDAFAKLDNAYIFRSRLRKRFGSGYTGDNNLNDPALDQLFSRLAVQVGTIGAPSSPVPGHAFNIGQMFSAGTQLFTVITASTVGNPTPAMLATGPGTGTFSTSNGAFALAGTGLAAGTPIFWYPSLPVMGLWNFENGVINNQPSFAFDTQFAYQYSGNQWLRSQTDGAPVFHGSNSDFFWASNWRGLTTTNDLSQPVLFVTNYHVTNYNGVVDATNDDFIYTFDTINGWRIFLKDFIPGNVGSHIQTCRIILPFKDRLVLLNTVERSPDNMRNLTFPQRCRFSHNGSPFSTNAFWEPDQANGGAFSDGGGYIDASTEEQIISAEFIKDRLIVYFERSTWELVYTGNQVLPFVWQKINTELGSESLLSTVPFDKVNLTTGTTGIMACNGSNVERIDDKIPDEIFKIRTINNGIGRISGIRDYYVEMVYWTFPEDGTNTNSSVYPQRILVYNYKNGTWAFNDDSITVFGYFEQQTGRTWGNTNINWEDMNTSWNSGTNQANFRQVIAGNQEGYVFEILPDVARNAGVLQITNIQGPTLKQLVIIDHNLNGGEFLLIENCQGSLTFNDMIVFVAAVIDKDTILVGFQDPTIIVDPGYTGGGTATRVSRINIQSKQWNPYIDQDRNFFLSKINFLVDNEGDGTEGAITVDYFINSSSTDNMIFAGQATGALLGTNILETTPYALVPYEQVQDRLWHPIYFQGEGNTVQLNMYYSTPQMFNNLTSLVDFELHALTLHTQVTTSRAE